MSESRAPRRILHLVIEGFPTENLANLAAPSSDAVTEIFQLTESSAREALEKIFVADTVTVWSPMR
ncbi:MAG: hypothetical protein LV479_03985 [Methylacidiphilales bacterium]|nr:hypothetical protein [Candidatus Methylacidiphilales bacterium]